MDDKEDRISTIRSPGGLSRRQLLAAGAGAAGVAAGAGLVSNRLQSADAAVLPNARTAAVVAAPVTHANMAIVGPAGAFKNDRGSRSIALLGVAFDVNVPYDAASGQATGKRQWKPIVVTKPISEASPQLLAACVSNENLASVTINFLRPNRTGAEVVYWTIKLTSAHIVDVSHYTSDNESLHLSAFQLQELEDIQFVFQKIVVTNVDGNTTAQDDWEFPG